MTRMQRLQDAFETVGIDALLVTDLTNVSYLSGFSGSNAQLLVTRSQAHLLTDPRYDQRARSLVADCEIHIYEGRSGVSWRGGPAQILRPLISGSARVGIEADNMSVTEFAGLEALFDGTEWIATSGVVEQLRKSKDAGELKLLREAMALADAAFEHIVGRLDAGRKERDVALDLEVFMRSNGAEAVSFHPIVGSGPLSAHIHHTASERVLEKGDLVLLDFGARYQGYCSDMTRTVVLGAASEQQAEIYDVVLEAQRAAIDSISPGALGSEVDSVARKVIADAGHAQRFNHGLGHGVGLAVHELPGLGKTSTDRLEVGEVVTVEPGIYLPGDGGIRIEDCVLVTADGAEVLTSARKESLLEL
jgi:Xaa-Pro aminopeptidase